MDEKASTAFASVGATWAPYSMLEGWGRAKDFLCGEKMDFWVRGGPGRNFGTWTRLIVDYQTTVFPYQVHLHGFPYLVHLHEPRYDATTT